ncbi:MAG: SIR2 family protein [Acidobacteriia bacterium]|nr:SIR2 family protein [Terriglobia bacterium]
MTTYVLGAGASSHAGYPLCSELWPKMAAWAIETESPDSGFRKAIDEIATLSGPVADIESVLTEVDLGQGAFETLEESDRWKIMGTIRRCVRAYFKSIHDSRPQAPLYTSFAKTIRKGDVVVTFNYDTALEDELIRAGKFRVRDGYGFPAIWDEPDSDITVLKPHGSINWIALLFGGSPKSGQSDNSLGRHPYIDNIDSALTTYPNRLLDNSFPGGGVTDGATTLVLPTHGKRFSVRTSLGDEWSSFYQSMWYKVAESLEHSDRVVIIGYSLPKADRMSRSVLLWSTNRRAEVLICSGSSSSSIRAEFEDHGFWRALEVGTFEQFLGK